MPFTHQMHQRNVKFTYSNDISSRLAQLRKWAETYFQNIAIFDSDVWVPQQASYRRDGTRYFKNFDIIGKVIWSNFYEY